MLVHASAAGKALLGALAPAARRQLLDACEPFSGSVDGVEIDRAALEIEVEQGTARGWHRSTGENVEDVAGLAKGFAIHGEPFALVVAGPKERLLRRQAESIEALQATFARIPPGLVD